ncbi:hypothetical protein BGZ76_002822 [Entomortierella beljakovae]|nr:hypothetical protein BGZ76_002822 [Entomortierella beljakovae]
MSSHDSSKRPNIPHDLSQDTIWEEEGREDTPLLQPQESNKPVDPVAAYVKIVTENLPWYKRPSPFWLFPIYGIMAVTGGMLSASIGQFQATLLCKEFMSRYPPGNTTELLLNEQLSSYFLSGDGSEFPSTLPPECNVQEIQAFTAKVLGIVAVLSSIAAAVSIGYYASLSDKYGRVKIMILASVNSLFMLISMIIMGKYWDDIGLPFLVISSLISNLAGGIGLAGTMSLAYAADCTDPSDRSLIFSWLHAGLFLGLGIGSYLGGLIVRDTQNLLIVIYIDIVAAIFSILFLVFFIPESIPSRQSARIRHLYEEAIKFNPKKPDISKKQDEYTAWYTHMTRSLHFLKPNGHNINLILLAAISFLQMLALKGTFSVLILYTNLIFHWADYEDGILLSLSSFVRLFSLLVLLPIFIHVYHKINNKKIAKSANNETQQTSTINDNTTSNQDTSNNHDHLYTDHPEQVIVGGLNDPNVASSLEHLGEDTLNLSDDESTANGRHRQRQSTTSSGITWSSDRTRIPASASSNSIRKKASASASSSTTAQDKENQKKPSDPKLDTWIIRVGFAINSLTYIGYGIATKDWQFFAWSALHATSIIAAPSIKSLLTTLVEPSQFGAVLGAFQIIDSIAGIFSPIVISWVYALTVKSWPQFVWYCCAFLTGICTVLAFMIRQRQFTKINTTA